MNKQTIISKVGVLMAAVFATAAVTSCNGTSNTSNPVIDGIQGPNVTFTNNTLTISAVLTNVIFQGGATIQIPKTQSSYIEVSPNLAGQGMLLQLGLNINDLSFLDGNANSLPANQLPGGRPIPGIVGGSLPSVAVQVPKWDNATFYIGSAFVGIFIPVKMNVQGVTGTFLFFDQSNKQVGTISIVGTDSNGQNSGILLMLNLKSITPSYSAAKTQSSLM
jgi:hypothetical protein